MNEEKKKKGDEIQKGKQRKNDNFERMKVWKYEGQKTQKPNGMADMKKKKNERKREKNPK